MSELVRLAEIQADGMNEQRGNLNDGFDCPKCLNKGFIAFVDGTNVRCKPCECMGRREAIRSAKRSGAEDLLRKFTFDNFTCTENWQTTIFNKAKKFAEKDVGLWFIGGQVGAGKTAISIAIVNRLLERKKECRFYIWKNLTTELNFLLTEKRDEYDRRMDEIANVEVLYIDEFIRKEPTKAEIEYAYRIINSRYMAYLGGKKMITLISSQNTLQKLMSLDEAITSRICEMAGDYVTSISDNPKYNWRLKLFRDKLNKDTL